MTSNRLRCLALGALLASAAPSLAFLTTRAAPVYSGLTAHEWGTFTSVAGPDGRAVEWCPLTGSTDLPSFVEHFRSAGFKRGLRGTVRMETPVLYFYAATEETVSVRVSFAKGVITEWYPHASRVEPHANLWDLSLYQEHVDGSIAWDAVTLTPNQTADLPSDRQENHYYAARQTTSTPLRVKTSIGDQYEKFLFYRGVSTFSAPIAAKLAVGDKVLVENRSGKVIPNTILFERRGEKVGYRIAGAVPGNPGSAGILPASAEIASQSAPFALDPPELTATIDSSARDLEGILVAQGLYQNEAQAMVQTWRDSWFEEGSRLLYIVPREFVDTVLPLTIKPAPLDTTRVFVGRLELVTPATEEVVARAFAERDQAALDKYGRFLEPILTTMINSAPNAVKAMEYREDLNLYENSGFR
jgi:hypothetical protein